jgi:hypothetical protein
MIRRTAIDKSRQTTEALIWIMMKADNEAATINNFRIK